MLNLWLVAVLTLCDCEDGCSQCSPCHLSVCFALWNGGLFCLFSDWGPLGKNLLISDKDLGNTRRFTSHTAKDVYSQKWPNDDDDLTKGACFPPDLRVRSNEQSVNSHNTRRKIQPWRTSSLGSSPSWGAKNRDLGTSISSALFIKRPG